MILTRPGVNPWRGPGADAGTETILPNGEPQIREPSPLSSDVSHTGM